LKNFSRSIDSGLISTIVDPMIKEFQLLLEFFWAMIKKFGCQFGQWKKFGEKFWSPNQANVVGVMDNG
jgi:hypothetical protein